MRVVVQRMTRARVVVAGTAIAAIDRGLLLLVGLVPGDGEAERSKPRPRTAVAEGSIASSS